VFIVLAICRLVNILNIEYSNEETKEKKITYQGSPNQAKWAASSPWFQ
jgi:hypothetical protein